MHQVYSCSLIGRVWTSSQRQFKESGVISAPGLHVVAGVREEETNRNHLLLFRPGTYEVFCKVSCHRDRHISLCISTNLLCYLYKNAYSNKECWKVSDNSLYVMTVWFSKAYLSFLSWVHKASDKVEVMWHDSDRARYAPAATAAWPLHSDDVKCDYVQRRGGWRGIESTWWRWCILSPCLRPWKTEQNV